MLEERANQSCCTAEGSSRSALLRMQHPRRATVSGQRATIPRTRPRMGRDPRASMPSRNTVALVCTLREQRASSSDL